MFPSDSQVTNKIARQIKAQLYRRVHRKMTRIAPLIRKIDASIKKTIINSSAIQLVDLMDGHQITSQEVLLTFIERTVMFGLENNYIIDEMFQEALSAARKCDQQRSKLKGKKSWRYDRNKNDCFPPFYGCPLSLKEVILYKDKISYAGFVIPTNPIPKEHSMLVEAFLLMGFIPFVRTNVPPACKIPDTVNRIFGYCHNPWKKGRSCGGSSGGESGLIASGCSPFGIGTDIGGSCRIPSEWTGLCTLKHGYRITRSGNCFYGKYSSGLPIKSQICPITTSVNDLILFFQFMCDQNNYYPSVDPRKHDIYIKYTPFDNLIFQEKPKLTIGYMDSLTEDYRCSLSHERVLQQVVVGLTEKGHRLKKIRISELSDVFNHFSSCFLGDNTLSSLEEMRKKEPPLKEYKIMYLLTLLPWPVRYALSWILRKKDPRTARLLQLSQPRSASDIVISFGENKKRERKVYESLCEQDIDVWITPGYPLPAPSHGTIGKFNLLLMNTTVWNAFHYPAGSVPVDIVKPDELHFEDKFNDLLTRDMKKEIQSSEGLPVGVQVISYPTHEEQVLYIMKEIEELAKFRQRNQCPSVLQERRFEI